ncbi:MAG: IMS domain-containing protein [Spirulinaceae cyanobacterium]
MRIPLDYYRILGVPIQAQAQQLSQAYHDRALQLPRREYSDLAINTRKQLLDEAYTILSDAERRAEYDQHFLKAAPIEATGTYATHGASSTPGPTLDIHPEQLIGAMLLLYELGEYELVLQLSEPLLEADAVLVPEQMQLVNNPLTRADIVLTVALSCLELGREQWQQGQSDRAAQTGHYAQELLLKEGLFPGIRGELRADMYKLRPYRIVELLTQEAGQAEDLRQKGLRLLQDMLAERGGIEGQGNDQSGLSLDDFLRFIQQIRNHLTTAEQQDLFAVEAQRPSAVGMYLLAYAKIAHGFAYSQPRAIAQAQTLLQRLGRYQDVHLEQAVCALLLGQTEAAGRFVERSQEYEPLAFIREQSQASPDLLPGLCLYGERWLQTEVFPHFRDTNQQTLSLKDYFANETVQAHLEQLSTGRSQSAAPTATPAAHQSASATTASGAATATMPAVAQAAAGSGAAATTTLQPPMPEQTAVAVAEPPSSPAPAMPLDSAGSGATDPTDSGDISSDSPQPEDLPVAPRSRARSQRQAQIQRNRWIFLGIGGLIALLGLGFLLSQVMQLISPRSPQSETALETDVPEVQTQPGEAPTETPPVEAATAPEPAPTVGVDPSDPQPIIATDEPIDEVLAEDIIQTWLAVKSLALGPEYDISRLDIILAEPALGTWQQLASELRSENTYRDYEHSVEVEKLTTDGNDPDRAAIEAAVREQATPYRNGQPEPGGAYDDNLRVRYDLVRQGDQWLVQDMQVLQ